MKRAGILYLISMILAPSLYSQEKPNVVLVMCDQMIPFLTGTYGHSAVKTPNFDRLASEGILFETAYSPNPICAPARASLMTGKYSSRIGVYDNASELPAGEPTMAHYFSYAGYETVLSGKMHFVGPDQWHGFDKRFLANIYPADFEWAKQRFDKVPRSHGKSYRADAIRIVDSIAWPSRKDLRPRLTTVRLRIESSPLRRSSMPISR